MEKEIYDVIILGGGAAGLTAGIYSSRNKLKTLILNEGTAGGQMILTHEVANYPGVPTTSGYALANTMKKQAKDFGCKIKNNLKITDANFSNPIKEVEVNGTDKYFGKAIIAAPGGEPRSPGIKGEKKFKGRGISYCATCDGDFFRDKEIIVIGGGNSALEEAVSLSKYASKVTIIHQFDHFQAFDHAVKEAMDNEKIEMIIESKVEEFIGEEKLEEAIVVHQKTGEKTSLKIDGAFIFIGYKPTTDFFKDKIALNEYGEILTNSRMKTNIEGVFAAGDCIEKPVRQITTAVSDGTIAALSAAEYVHGNKDKF